MKRLLDAQTCGSLGVLGAFGASEAAAAFLDASPGSPLAWYLNLELFRCFEPARRPESPLHVLFGPNALTINLLLLVLIIGARWLRFRFAVALFSNLAFVATVMLACASLRAEPTPMTASLTLIDHDLASGGLLAGLLTMSFSAFALSHIGFMLAILRQPAPGSMPVRAMPIG